VLLRFGRMRCCRAPAGPSRDHEDSRKSPGQSAPGSAALIGPPRTMPEEERFRSG
jgi:hypothetical protein